MEKIIQFIANYDEWQAIKKLRVDEKTDPKMVMEFLASLGTSFDAKIEENLRKIVDLGKMDAALDEIQYGKSEEEIANALRTVNSRGVSAAIKEIVQKPELQKNEQRELEQFCRVYAFKKALKNCGLSIDYSSVEIPGMKRLQKRKV